MWVTTSSFFCSNSSILSNGISTCSSPKLLEAEWRIRTRCFNWTWVAVVVATSHCCSASITSNCLTFMKRSVVIKRTISHQTRNQGEGRTPPRKMCWTYFEAIGHSLIKLPYLRKRFAPLVSQTGYCFPLNFFSNFCYSLITGLKIDVMFEKIIDSKLSFIDLFQLETIQTQLDSLTWLFVNSCSWRWLVGRQLLVTLQFNLQPIKIKRLVAAGASGPIAAADPSCSALDCAESSCHLVFHDSALQASTYCKKLSQWEV